MPVHLVLRMRVRCEVDEMNCKEFNELVDSYLHDELLVETNHSLLRHIEMCQGCRDSLANHRDVRSRLQSAVRNAEEGRIDPRFEIRVRSALLADHGSRKAGIEASFRRFGFAGLASFLLVATAFIAFYQTPPEIAEVNPPETNPSNTLTASTDPGFGPIYANVNKDAVDDHKNCALTHNLEARPISLGEAAEKFEAANRDLDKTVIETLKKAFGAKVDFIKAHHCLINGRAFAHVVVRFEGKVVSFLMTRKEQNTSVLSRSAQECGNDGDLKVACFDSQTFHLFVISDLDAEANLKLAETLEGSVHQHIAEAGARV